MLAGQLVELDFLGKFGVDGTGAGRRIGLRPDERAEVAAVAQNGLAAPPSGLLESRLASGERPVAG